MKLHKLLYYAQAWSLVWDRAPLFEERLEAWVGGPVSPHVYGLEVHEGGIPSTSEELSVAQRATIDVVLTAYGPKSGQWLSELTHRERPWREARRGLQSSERSKQVIRLESLVETYSAYRVPFKELPPTFIQGLDLMVSLPLEEVDLITGGKSEPADALLEELEAGEDLSGEGDGETAAV